MDLPDARALPFLNRAMLDFSGSCQFKLQAVLIASDVPRVVITGMTKQGPFRFDIDPLGNNTNEVFEFQLSDIPITLTCSVDQTLTSGVIDYVVLNLLVNESVVAVLAQGIISPITGVTYPTQLPLQNSQFFGVAQQISFSSPAVGTDLAFTLPLNQYWELLGLTVHIVASATVASRTVRLDINKATGGPIVRADGTAVTASQTVDVTFVPGGTTAIVIASALHEVALPPRIFLPSGSTIATTTANIQAGDQISVSAQVRKQFQSFAD